MNRRIGKAGMDTPTDLANTTYHVFLIMSLLYLIFGVFIFLLAKSTEQYVPTELSRMVHTERFINNCFASIDAETGRKYAGVMDAALFTQENLRTCYLTVANMPEAAYALRLKSDTGTFDEQISTSNYKSGGEQFVRRVLIVHNGQMEPAKFFVNYEVKT